MDVTAIIKYFDLNEHPFMTSPDPRYLYFSSQVKEALAKCEFMARDRIGPIYMYGPIGSGKTSLVRRLQEKLSQVLVLFAPLVSAATGDNCSVDLTSEIPDTQDWNNITVLKGSDGSAWRRGTISDPVDALYLKEGQTSDISALVGAKTPTQFFIYAANVKVQGVLNKPGEGVCFEGPVADDAGVATFSINARAVWGNLGKKLVLDVFYRLPQKYDDLSGSAVSGSSQKQSLQLYTFILPRIVDVKLLPPPSSGSNGSNNLLSNDIRTVPGKWESTRSPGGECQAVGFECQESNFNGENGTIPWKDWDNKDWMPKYLSTGSGKYLSTVARQQLRSCRRESG